MVDRFTFTLAFIIITFYVASGAPCGTCCSCCCEPCSSESKADEIVSSDEQLTRSAGFLSDMFQSAGKTISDWVAEFVAPYLEVINDWSQKALSGPNDIYTLDGNEQAMLLIPNSGDEISEETFQKWSEMLATMNWHEFMVAPEGGTIQTSGSNKTQSPTPGGTGMTIAGNEWQAGQTIDGNTFKQMFSVSSTFT